MNEIPAVIVKAAGKLLEPYGVNVEDLLALHTEQPVRWESVTDAAKRLGVSTVTMRALLDAGKIRGGRTESKRFVDSVDLDRFLIESEKEARKEKSA